MSLHSSSTTNSHPLYSISVFMEISGRDINKPPTNTHVAASESKNATKTFNVLNSISGNSY